MQRESYLAVLRKSVGLTQRDIAKALGFEEPYGQKRISQFESELAKPTSKEIRKLAGTLGTTVEDLEAYFSDPSSHEALRLFSRLAVASQPALMSVCYSGPPKIFLDAAIRSKLMDALKSNLFLAMFVPFPKLIAPTDEESSTLILQSYYSKVWGSVIGARQKLLAELGNSVVEKKVGVFGPKHAMDGSLLVPPFLSRYALLSEQEEGGHHARSLHLWVETMAVKRLQIIGTDEDDGALDQIDAWEAFFGQVVKAWAAQNRLPAGQCGYWQSVEFN